MSNDVTAASVPLDSLSEDSLSAETSVLPPPVERGTQWSAVKIAAGVHAGNEEAFSELHRRFASRLHRYALVIARGNEHAAAEVVQNTFLRAIRGLHRAADDDALWCWLAKAARCAAADSARRAQRRSTLLARLAAFRAADPPPPAENPEALWHQALEAAVAVLPVEDRSLLDARYDERASLAEIAARTGTTERAIESRLARLRAALRGAILSQLSRLP